MSFLDRLKGLRVSDDTAIQEPVKGELLSPVSGKVASMEEVPDEVFASGVLGKGCAVWPEDGTVRAPISGTITVAMPHAVGIAGLDGVEALVHIGIDTVEMGGAGFDLLAKKGSAVKAGQTVVRFDREKVKAAGHPDCVVLAVSNSAEYLAVECIAGPGREVRAGDRLLRAVS